VGTQSRPPRPSGTRPSAQYFLRSRRLADELVSEARVRDSEHVLEIGAGSGRLTEALARRARLVTAVEIDPVSAEWLRAAFAADPRVEIVHGNVLRISPPRSTYRAFGNIPFAGTTAILRRLLDDPASPLARADLLIQYEVARKRAAVWPSGLTALGWLPWWRFTLARRISRLAFEPFPSVDAGLLTVSRREPPLLEPGQRPAFVDLVQAGFGRSALPVRRSLRPELSSRAWKNLARDRGIRFDARAAELDVFDWVALFRLTQSAARTPAASIPTRRRRRREHPGPS
jgi:23S rRNA (adenine-N6)-dimethyltransferase